MCRPSQLKCFPALFVILALCYSPIAAREWKSRRGYPTYEAELVSVHGNYVSVRTADGKVRSHTIADMVREDQVYVFQLQAKQRANPPAQLQITPELTWGKIQATVNGKSQNGPTLCVALQTRNHAAASATRFGKLKIEEFHTDSPFPLPLTFSMDRKQEDLAELSRPDSHDALLDGLVFDFSFFAGSAAVTRINRLKGSFTILTGEPFTAAIRQVAVKQDFQFEDRLLKELGLSVIVNPAGSKLGRQSYRGLAVTNFTVQTKGNEGQFFSIVPCDAAGVRYFPENVGSKGTAKDRVFHFGFADPVPSDLEFHVTVLKNLHEEVVPFDFRDLDVPPPEPSKY